jgi:HPt (histidine-containing phosphotransfer) domain-containing protein
MTLQELYQLIGGDYTQATNVLRVEKLIDKHIRKLPKNGVVDNLIAAGESMDPTELFETAHAVKGVCANLGLVKLSDAASEIAEEYRPGNSRSMSDEQVKEKLQAVIQRYEDTTRCIREYEAQG